MRKTWATASTSCETDDKPRAISSSLEYCRGAKEDDPKVQPNEFGFLHAVRLVEIPKPGGGKRPFGIPTVEDRIAQQAAVMFIEPSVEPCFDQDSYGDFIELFCLIVYHNNENYSFYC